jgi:hypothetical protein
MLENRRRRQTATARTSAGILLSAVLVVAAIAAGVPRFNDTATNVQVAADVAAMAAVLARSRGNTEVQAIQAGMDIGALNLVDGKPIDPAGIGIVAGFYDPRATPGSRFAPGRMPHNAFRSTVRVGGVRFATASILSWETGTDIEERAVATAGCPSNELVNFPMAVCAESLTEGRPGETCTDHPKLGHMVPDDGETGCWANVGPGTYESVLPEVCGGAGGEGLAQGDIIDLQSGRLTSFLRHVQCCVACRNQHKFTVPVIECARPGSCGRRARAQGFATINLAQYQDVILAGSGRNDCRQYFPDCTNPAPDGSIENPEHKRCSAGCSNVGADCQNDGDCSGCSGGCEGPRGLYLNQTCGHDIGGSGGGRCFGNSSVMLGQQ